MQVAADSDGYASRFGRGGVDGGEADVEAEQAAAVEVKARNNSWESV